MRMSLVVLVLAAALASGLFASLWSASWLGMDPSGSCRPEGLGMDPDGAPQSDAGLIMDPNG